MLGGGSILYGEMQIRERLKVGYADCLFGNKERKDWEFRKMFGYKDIRT